MKKSMLSLLLAFMFVLISGIGVVASPADEHVHGEDCVHDDDVYHVFYEDDQYIRGRNAGGEVVEIDKTQLASSMLRGLNPCGCNAGTTSSTYQTHSQTSPTCKATNTVYKRCVSCGIQWEFSKTTSSHPYNRSLCGPY